ncbi:MAG: hypothetical protein ICCCNLDF_03511 [Planctomycetes bacterium]|nr:hypothetical protein [Planctomycetota bacterium]
MTGSESFWPDNFEQLDVVPPAKILLEQAGALAKKTSGKLKMSVRTRTDSSGSESYITAVLRAQGVNYSYELLKLHHSLDFFPVNVYEIHGEEVKRSCDTEEAFKTTLKQILSGEKTRRVLAALIARVSEGAEEEPPF